MAKHARVGLKMSSLFGLTVGSCGRSPILAGEKEVLSGVVRRASKWTRDVDGSGKDVEFSKVVSSVRVTR